MDSIEFTAYGHENVRATHKTTLEFTKSSDLRLDGDCIIAVKANFDTTKIKQLIQNYDKIKISIVAGNLSETIEATTNKKFESQEEIVIRLGEFDSIRTLGLRATKAAVHLNRELIQKLKNSEQKIQITIRAV